MSDTREVTESMAPNEVVAFLNDGTQSGSIPTARMTFLTTSVTDTCPWMVLMTMRHALSMPSTTGSTTTRSRA